jgi:integrase
MTKVLTQRGVETAKPKAKRYGKPDGLVPGMQLIVQTSGAKSYTLFARLNGKQINIRLGPAGVLTLAQARDEARSKLGRIAAGKDPRTVKREAQPNAETFAVVAERFVERHVKPHCKSARDIERLIARDILPRWRHRPINSITNHDVIALLDSVADRAPISANRVLATIRRLFNWCIERGTIEAPSPCDRIKKPAPETARDRVLDDAELALVWQAAGTLGYPYGPMVRLLALTGQRRCEVGGMRWGELDPGLTLWTLPRERVKNGVLHHVPVAAAARDVLLGLPRLAGEAGYVFTTDGTVPAAAFSGAKRHLDTAIAALNGGAPVKPWVLHDLRRSMASGAAKLGVRIEVIERCLNHRSGSFAGVTGTYQRYDFRAEMQEALELWGQHVLALGQGEPALLRLAAGR